MVAPAVVVSLGVTAGSALAGPGFKIADRRGKPTGIDVAGWHGLLVSTIHPSAVLRARDGGAREQADAGLVEDLRLAVRACTPSA